MSRNYPQFYSIVETLPRAQLRQLQEKRLLAQLERTFAHSPIMRQAWGEAGVHPKDIRSIEDFQEHSPFISQDMIRRFRDEHNDPCGGLAELSDPRMTTMTTTSGTTGDPSPMPMRIRVSSHENYMRDMWHIGMRPGDYMISPLFTFRGGPANGLTANKEIGVTPIYFNHDPSAIPRMIEAQKRFQPTAWQLMSMPLLIGLEKYFEATGEDGRAVFSSLKGTIFGGEALSPRLEKLVQSWGIEFLETTALGDVTAATTCKAHDGFHAYEDSAFVECLDPNGNTPVADGEVGELVVTAINDTLLPPFRFRTDDLVTINREPCPCGRTHLRFHMLGRKGDQIIVKGRKILPLHIRALVESRHETAAGLFQIVKRELEMDVLVVRVGYNPARLSGTADVLIGWLQEQLAAKLEVPVRIELVLDDDLLKLGPPHKIPRVTKQ
jgi:phenylacetate-CoA ligase